MRHVFLQRINQVIKSFIRGWNNHRQFKVNVTEHPNSLRLSNGIIYLPNFHIINTSEDH